MNHVAYPVQRPRMARSTLAWIITLTMLGVPLFVLGVMSTYAPPAFGIAALPAAAYNCVDGLLLPWMDAHATLLPDTLAALPAGEGW